METPDEALPALVKHKKWIEEELNNEPVEFKLFTKKRSVETSHNKKLFDIEEHYHGEFSRKKPD